MVVEQDQDQNVATSRGRALFDERQQATIKFLATRCPGTADMFGGSLPKWAKIGLLARNLLRIRIVLDQCG